MNGAVLLKVTLGYINYLVALREQILFCQIILLQKIGRMMEKLLQDIIQTILFPLHLEITTQVLLQQALKIQQVIMREGEITVQ